MLREAGGKVAQDRERAAVGHLGALCSAMEGTGHPRPMAPIDVVPGPLQVEQPRYESVRLYVMNT